jgi:hypothetical protein
MNRTLANAWLLWNVDARLHICVVYTVPHLSLIVLVDDVGSLVTTGYYAHMV